MALNERDSLINRLSQFVKRLGTPIQEAYLFGSRARGDELKESDVDVILVSAAFDQTDFIQRMVNVSKSWDGPEPLEPLYYTPAEFLKKKNQLTMVHDAMQYAIRIPV